MNERKMIILWEGVFTLGKGITYILVMAALVKYLVSN